MAETPNNSDYENIDRPYDSSLYRSEPNDTNGNVMNQPIKSDGDIGDVWIKNFIRSENWQPKTNGFYINGQTGYAEFMNVFISGDIQALTGTIGGFTIGATTISATNLVLTSGAANAANITVGTGANAAGLNSANAVGDIAFWAGSTFANRATAAFQVTAAGVLTATSATITGAINATSGTFSGSITASGTISGGTITGATITGSTLSTATSGQRVVLTTTLAQYYNSSNVQVGTVFGDTSGFIVSSDSGLLSLSAASGQTVIISASGASAFTIFDMGNTRITPSSNGGLSLGVVGGAWNNIFLIGTLRYQAVDQPVIYHGYVNSDGTEGSTFPSGWSSARTATGRYTVTHSIGTTDYSVVATPQSPATKTCTIESLSSSTFVFRVANVATAALEDNSFMFILCETP